MNPERLLARFAFSPGACWKCERTAQVTVCGEIAGPSGVSFPLPLCGVCVLRLEQMVHAYQERAQFARPRTPEALAVYYAPVLRDPVREEELRSWIDSLMEPLPHRDIAALVFGVRGQITFPTAC